MINTTTIFFTTTEGEDVTQFDTHDAAELLELFHMFLMENKMTLLHVDSVEFGEEKAEYV